MVLSQLIALISVKALINNLFVLSAFNEFIHCVKTVEPKEETLETEAL
jgi:hypothetical protein